MNSYWNSIRRQWNAEIKRQCLEALERKRSETIKKQEKLML